MAAELSAYEAKRRRRVEENRAALLALQIERLPAPKRPRQDAPSKRAAPAERRQSARLQALQAPVSERLKRVQARERREERYEEVVDVPRTYNWPSATLLDVPMVDLRGRTTVGPRVSSKELEINVGRFHSQWLGRQLVPLGKTWAMQGVVDMGLGPEKKPIVTFSRLSGVQQFRNAVALFVNVERDANYDNAFQEAGEGADRAVFFRWFAQNNWHRGSPAVQRLARVRRGVARWFLEGDSDAGDHPKEEQDGVQDEPLILFLRQVQGAYVYCGRLGFLGMRSATQPLEFRWQLLDADALNWGNIRRQMIDRVPDDSESPKATKPELI